MKTFRTLEWAPSWCQLTIQDAVRPTDEQLEKYADWYKPMALFGSGEHIDLKHFNWRDINSVLGGRKSTHAFPGCNNLVWILTPEEEERIMSIERERTETKAQEDADKKASAEAALQAKFDQARQTGQDQVLDIWLAECDGSVDECSSDSVRRMVRPDGTTYISRTHCF